MARQWKKNNFLLLGIVALLITLTRGVDSVEITADIAYVVKTTNGADQYLLDELADLGYSYEIIREFEVPSTNFSQYRLLMVGDERLNNPENIPIDRFKSMTINSYNYYKQGSNWQLGWSSSAGSKTSPTSLRIANLSSEIVMGLPIQFFAYDITDPLVKTSYLKGQKPQGIDITVFTPPLSSDAVVATLRPGQRLLNGKILEERALFFGVTEARYWTSETREMFTNSIEWLLVGEDLDEDGFFSDEDCNDQDENVYPGAEEIPYDGIDQDCNGSDVDDVDGDGYAAAEAGGFDCNDTDPQINPENPDPVLNCVNDAPSIIEIAVAPVYIETQVVEIEVFAYDPEGDELEYAIDNDRFVIDGTVLRWHTTYDDAGTHTFTVSVFDGDFSDNDTVAVSIANLNRPPMISAEISDLTWEEDSAGVTINLNDYFSDLDGDALEFGIENSSGYEEIFVMFSQQSSGIVSFNSLENFFGEAWIEFLAYDGEDSAVSNRVDLYIVPVNDPVEFLEEIDTIAWNEDGVLIETLNLNYYFHDVDSVLEYTVTGNDHINITIVGSIVSFYPPPDFAGSEQIIFTATDGEFSASSNSVLLSVVEVGEAPVFDPLACDTEIAEDEVHSCNLSASDFEDNELTFFVDTENNLRCTIDGDIITYVSQENYFGEASCTLVVSDMHGIDSITFDVLVNPVNDAPRIVSRQPGENRVNVAEGFEQRFGVYTDDVDSHIVISWMVNGNAVLESQGFDSEYSLIGSPGSYVVEARVSDSEFVKSTTWEVIIGAIGDFTCSEVGGFILSDDQACSGTLLGVSDSESCCSLPGVPAFRDADACEVISENLYLTIKEPKTHKEIEIGENIRVKLEIENNFEKDQNFDVDIHLYNLNEDKSTKDISENLEVDAGKSDDLTLDLSIPEDLDLDDTYVLLVEASDEICTQQYVPLTLTRPDDLVVITDLDIPREVACSDSVQVKVRIENRGSDDQDVRVLVESRDLGIEESTGIFELEKFDEDNREVKEFVFTIPDDVVSETYEFESSVSYSGRDDRIVKEINIECSNEGEQQHIVTSTEIKGPIILDFVSNNENAGRHFQLTFPKPKMSDYPILMGLSVFNFILVTVIMVMYVIYVIQKNWVY